MTLARDRDFLKLWAGQAVSELGSHFTLTGLPLAAILLLDAGALEMGVLTAASAVAVVVGSLAGGVLADRMSRRGLMIATDLGRAAILASVPIAIGAGVLSMTHLYAVAFVAAGLGVVFEITYRALLPGLVGRGRVLEANTRLGITSGVAESSGPALAGAVVQVFGAAVAIVVDAVSFLVSAASLVWLRRPLPREERPVAHPLRDIAEGAGYVARHPLLRPMLLATLVSTFFGWGIAALYLLYGIRELGLSPVLMGVTVSLGGVSALGGSLLATRATRLVGIGPAIGLGRLLYAVTGLLIPLAGGPAPLAFAMLAISQLLGDAFHSIFWISELSLRQGVTPDRLLGRVNAANVIVAEGIGPLGALAAAALAESLGLRAALLIAVIGTFGGAVILLASPLRQVRAITDAALPG